MHGMHGVFTEEVSGLLLSAMRERALDASEDLLVMRWQREQPRA